jgi:hypothetical protein
MAGRPSRGPRIGKKKGKAVRKKGACPKPGREALAAELAVELARVRGLLKESGENLLARLDGEIVQLARYLSGQDLPDEKPLLPPPGRLSEMIARAKALKVKPQKGRVKDVGRIAELMKSLASGMPPTS